MKLSARSLWTAFWVVMIFMASSFSMNAQKHNKYADSYNFRKGIEAFEARDTEKAEEAFIKEVGEHPTNGYAYLYIAHIQFVNAEYGEALSSIEQALKYIPKKDKEYKSACYYKRAGIYQALNKLDQAISDFTTAISYDREDEDSYWERAQIYYEQGKYDLADADYREMQKIDQNSAMTFMGLGRNELHRKNFQNAVDIFDNVVALYSDYSSGYAFRAEAYMGLGKYMEAASDVVKALELDYNDKAFGLMVSVADSAFVQMNIKLKAMAVTDSNNSYWPYCLGVINEHTKKYQDAITSYLKAIKLDESDMIYSRVSKCYEGMGEWASAIEYIDKAIALDEKDTDYLLSKADLYYEAGQPDTAIRVMDQYIDAVPDYAGGYYYRGWYKDNVKDVDGAIEDYTTVLTLDPDISSALLLRGTMYLLKDEADLAKKDFELVLQKDTVADNGSNAMYALFHLGRVEEAVQWMDKIMETHDDEGVWYEAACLYSLMGETEKSLYYLEESLKRGNKSYHHMMLDDDMDNVRTSDEFTALMAKYFPQETESGLTDSTLIEYTERVVEVPFTRQGGVTQVKCNINGLPLHFIFDTGAADVSISRVEATFMFKNNYLSPDDVIGKARYVDANGDISVGTVLNIKKITFGGLVLENVRAGVVESNNAPLLLGQSVLNRLGKIEIDYDKSVLKITSKEKVTLSRVSGEHNGHKYVDLGLSVKWATCNIGASSPEEYGDYFAWGETSTKNSFTEGKRKASAKSDISGNPLYDAARANWDGAWRMPTKAEYQELIDNCTWTWTTYAGKEGFVVTSKKNGNSIFLPAAGFKNDTALIGAGERSVYWSSTHHESYASYVYKLDLSCDVKEIGPLGPFFGLTVRPVTE